MPRMPAPSTRGLFLIADPYVLYRNTEHERAFKVAYCELSTNTEHEMISLEQRPSCTDPNTEHEMIFFNPVFSTAALSTSGLFLWATGMILSEGLPTVVLDRRVAVRELIEDEEAEESDNINMTDE